uniref:Uncharacterized protein n=1 Tax=Setaria italica TaxID=4555 RepID=K4AHP4_SETIT
MKKIEEDYVFIEFSVYVKSCDVVISMLYIQIVGWSNHLCRNLILLCFYLLHMQLHMNFNFVSFCAWY